MGGTFAHPRAAGITEARAVDRCLAVDGPARAGLCVCVALAAVSIFLHASFNSGAETLFYAWLVQISDYGDVTAKSAVINGSARFRFSFFFSYK